jgi:hypothetical protein
MDNSDAFKFGSALREIMQQEHFLHGIKSMVTNQYHEPFNLFDQSLHCLSTLKKMIHTYMHICDREAGRYLRKDWLHRQNGHGQVDLNWCCRCHQSGCILE